MRLSWIGVMTAAMIALPATAAPSTSATAAEPHSGMPGAQPRARPVLPAVDHLIDLNSASRKELMTLPGIGAAEATKIIANRPYRTKSELVTKDVMQLGPFLSLRRYVVAMPGAAAKGES